MRQTAYLGLGSDVGRRTKWIEYGLEALAHRGLKLARVSSYWLTEPVGDAALPWFANCVAAVREPPAPDALLRLCLETECLAGRRRNRIGAEPRTLDLDVLLYDSRTVDSARLTIPHPRMHQRRFVLEPLCEIAPELQHPILGKTMRQLRDELESPERAWLLAPGTSTRGARG